MKISKIRTTPEKAFKLLTDISKRPKLYTISKLKDTIRKLGINKYVHGDKRARRTYLRAVETALKAVIRDKQKRQITGVVDYRKDFTSLEIRKIDELEEKITDVDFANLNDFVSKKPTNEVFAKVHKKLNKKGMKYAKKYPELARMMFKQKEEKYGKWIMKTNKIPKEIPLLNNILDTNEAFFRGMLKRLYDNTEYFDLDKDVRREIQLETSDRETYTVKDRDDNISTTESLVHFNSFKDVPAYFLELYRKSSLMKKILVNDAELLILAKEDYKKIIVPIELMKVIKDKNDLIKFTKKLYEKLLRPVATSLSVVKILSLTIQTTSMNFPMGDETRESKLYTKTIKNDRSITYINSEDSICLWCCLALHINKGKPNINKKNVYTAKAKKLLKEYTCKTGGTDFNLKTYKGVELSELPKIEDYFKIRIYILRKVYNPKTEARNHINLMRKSDKDYDDIIYLNECYGHLAYIRDYSKYVDLFICHKCDSQQSSLKSLTEHVKNCRIVVKPEFRKNYFEVKRCFLEEIFDKQYIKKLNEEFIVFDLETSSKVSEIKPKLDSKGVEIIQKLQLVKSLDIMSYGLCYREEVDYGNDYESMIKDMIKRARVIIRNKTKLANEVIDTDCLTSFKKVRLLNELNTVNVIGFNSSAFDIKVLKRYFVEDKRFPNEDINMIKQCGNYNSLSLIYKKDKSGEIRFKFKDVIRFLVAGTSLEKFLLAMSDGGSANDLKFVFPYDLLTTHEEVSKIKISDITHQDFYSSLKEKNITEEQYSEFKSYCKLNNVITLADYLKVYNIQDVKPFYKATLRWFNILTDNFEVFPHAYISVPHIARWIAYQQMKEHQVKVCIPKNEVYQTFRDNLRAGLSIIFNRYADENTIINGKRCEGIFGFDANMLYTWCMQQTLPCGDITVIEKSDVIISDNDLENIFINNPSSFLEVDCHVPKELRGKESLGSFPPIIVKKTITNEDLTECMAKYKVGSKYSQTKLVAKFSCKKQLFYIPLLKYMKKLGVRITKVYTLYKTAGSRYLKNMMTLVSKKRAESDANPDLAPIGEVYKLVSNSMSGSFALNREKFQKTALVNKMGFLNDLNNSDFTSIEIYPNAYEVSRKWRKICIKEPLHITNAIYDLSKMIMLQFYYDCLSEVRKDILLCEMDTDSLYFAVNDINILNRIDPMKAKKYLFIDMKYRRTPGYFKLESIGKRFAGLKAKMYVIDGMPDKINEMNGYAREVLNVTLPSKKRVVNKDGSYPDIAAKDARKLINKVKAKGIKKALNMKTLTFKAYKSIILESKSFTTKNKGFRYNPPTNLLYLYSMVKDGLSPFYDKLRMNPDGISGEFYP